MRLSVWFLDPFREALYAGHSFSAANKRAQTPRSQAPARHITFLYTPISLFFFLLLSLSLLPVKLSNMLWSETMYSAACSCLQNKKRWYLQCFCRIKDENHPKHRYLPCPLANAQKTIFFAMIFSTRGLKCIVNTSVSFTFIASSSQSKPAMHNLYLESVL